MYNFSLILKKEHSSQGWIKVFAGPWVEYIIICGPPLLPVKNSDYLFFAYSEM